MALPTKSITIGSFQSTHLLKPWGRKQERKQSRPLLNQYRNICPMSIAETSMKLDNSRTEAAVLTTHTRLLCFPWSSLGDDTTACQMSLMIDPPTTFRTYCEHVTIDTTQHASFPISVCARRSDENIAFRVCGTTLVKVYVAWL